MAALAIFVVAGLAVLTPGLASAASGERTYEYTGEPQTFTVPAGVSAIGVDLYGAQGDGIYGGLGGRTRAVLPVTPGEILQVNVGGAGVGDTGGWNGGGNGDYAREAEGAGGGATDIRRNPHQLGDRLAVAAGGGGGVTANPYWGAGGSGGGTSGQSGGRGDGSVPSCTDGGGGGTPTAGGASGGDYGSNGDFGQGARGGFTSGGGGGGWYGGGSGGSNSNRGCGIGGGGGAGSSYTTSNARDMQFFAGYRFGAGRARIAWPPSAMSDLPVPSSPTSYAYTGSPQIFFTPGETDRISVALAGGSGNGGGLAGGGSGGVVNASFRSVPGQPILVFVGEGGKPGPGGSWNGGGKASSWPPSDADKRGAGGGATDIRVGGWLPSDRVLVAGGGGGASVNSFYGSPANGGAGGGITGGAGQDGKGCSRPEENWKGGGGGTQTEPGQTYVGYSRGAHGPDGAEAGFGGGGGGGGWFGGGAGGGDSTRCASSSEEPSASGGGGGSGYAATTAIDATFSSNNAGGDGWAQLAVGPVGGPPPAPQPTPSGHHFRVLLKAWIPQPRVLDPERPFNVPYLLNPERNCLTPPLRKMATTTISSRYRGDSHVGFEGSFRVQPVVDFDWDGQKISNFRYVPTYGETHRDLLYHWDTVTRACNIQTALATRATTATQTSPTNFRLSFSSKNPALRLQALTPPIDSAVAGQMLPDGRLKLGWATDLFPSHGLQVQRDGVVIAEDVVNDASCLSDGFVQSAAAAVSVAWGLTNQDNRGGMVVGPEPLTDRSRITSPLCSADGSVVQFDAADGAVGGRQATKTTTSNDITVVQTNGRAIPLRKAVSQGIVEEIQVGAAQTIVSTAARPVILRVRGRKTMVRVTRLSSRSAQDAHVYGPITGPVTVRLPARTVALRGRLLRPARPDRKPPRTRARVRRLRGSALIRLKAADPSGIRATYYRVGRRRHVYVRPFRLRIRRLLSVRFASVDAAGNVEPLRRLPSALQRRAGRGSTPHQ